MLSVERTRVGVSTEDSSGTRPRSSSSSTRSTGTSARCSATWSRPSGASTSPTTSTRSCAPRVGARFELTLGDAWVWDMYRPNRFVSSVHGRDVQGRQRRGAPGELEAPDTCAARRGRRSGAAGEEQAAAWYEASGYEVLARNWRCRDGELDLVVAPQRHDRVLRGQDPHVGTRSARPAEAVTRRQAASGCGTWPPAGSRSTGTRPTRIRFDVACVLAGEITVLEACF